MFPSHLLIHPTRQKAVLALRKEIFPTDILSQVNPPQLSHSNQLKKQNRHKQPLSPHKYPMNAPSTKEKSKELVSIKQQLLDWWAPDVNLLALSNQDTALKNLELVNIDMEIKHQRQLALEARGKFVRVGVYDGMRPVQAKDSKKKKRK